MWTVRCNKGGVNLRFANNSTSLLHDSTTNLAETFNSVVGGKRSNFSLKGSYELRCKAAAISFNTNEDFWCRIQKHFCNGNIGVHLERIVAEKIKRASLSNKLRKRQKRSDYATIDEYYGTGASISAIADMSEEVYARKCTLFSWVKTQLNNTDRDSMFDATLLQTKSEIWKIERRKRLTASSFGKICKLIKTTCASKLYRIYCTLFFQVQNLHSLV